MNVRAIRLLAGILIAGASVGPARAAVAPWGATGLGISPSPAEVGVVTGLAGATGNLNLGSWASATMFGWGAPLGQDLTAYAQFGLRSGLGLRGVLHSPFLDLRTGWDVQQRMDYYPNLVEGPGLARPLGGLVPLPGTMAQGLQVALLTGYKAGPLDISLAPHLAMMSNRTGFGARYEVALNRGAFEVGYGGVWQWNPGNPSPGSAFSGQELDQILGLRWALNEVLALHGLGLWTFRDAYGLSSLQGLLGIQWSPAGWSQDRSTAMPKAAPQLVPATPPSPEPTVRPTPRPFGR